tara:strand:- start:630 stop:839 length:210 start_codon:yes stop_codon:yes gene_type:complete
MPVEFYFIVIPFFTIPVFLVSLDYLNKNAAVERKRRNVIDFDKYIKQKGKGDAVDSAIAELIDIDQIVA